MPRPVDSALAEISTRRPFPYLFSCFANLFGALAHQISAALQHGMLLDGWAGGAGNKALLRKLENGWAGWATA